MITLIDGAQAIGDSDPITIVSGSNAGQDIHSFQVSTLGSPTKVTIRILGTIDGVNYNCILEHEFTDEEIDEGSTIFHLINKPIPKIKARVHALDGGVSPTVSVFYFKGSSST